MPNQRQQLPGVSTFEQALARADYGSLGVFATSQQSTVSGFGVGTGHGIWSSFASFQDELAMGVEEGFFRIPVSVSGDSHGQFYRKFSS